ncbi:hypothetical protein FRB95_011926 [Tulasnella sp. JGI-2019a]|nr:hypothetical protein FRB95_011926 [Tulasnella sp. JGI-2019a]
MTGGADWTQLQGASVLSNAFQLFTDGGADSTVRYSHRARPLKLMEATRISWSIMDHIVGVNGNRDRPMATDTKVVDAIKELGYTVNKRRTLPSWTTFWDRSPQRDHVVEGQATHRPKALERCPRSFPVFL